MGSIQLDPEAKEVLKGSVINQYHHSYKEQIEPYIMDIFVARQKQGFSYTPSQVIGIPILLCKARDSNFVIDMVDDKNYWTEFANKVEVRMVNGNHDTMLNSQYAESLAKEISKQTEMITQSFTKTQKVCGFFSSEKSLTGNSESLGASFLTREKHEASVVRAT